MESKDYKFLTIVNPSNNFDKLPLLRVYNHLRKIIGFSNAHTMWYEGFDIPDKHHHLHAIIKKTEMPDREKISAAFKKSKCKWLEYSYDIHTDDPVEIEQDLDLTKFNFKLTEIKDNGHLQYLIHEYKFKEQEQLCDFID